MRKVSKTIPLDASAADRPYRPQLFCGELNGGVDGVDGVDGGDGDDGGDGADALPNLNAQCTLSGSHHT